MMQGEFPADMVGRVLGRAHLNLGIGPNSYAATSTRSPTVF